ncbi:MAG: hypothetical protein H6825_07255 [Planctomycetes bacterium]|nr:hypothetical protein [Planctomycetota bacterium]
MLVGATLLLYPPLVWFGLTHGSPRRVALVLLCVLLPAVALRLRSSRRDAWRGLAILPLVTVAALLAAALLDSAGLVLVTPVVINLLLLAAFGATLRRRDARGRPGTPMIERFARLQEPELPPDKVAWCRAWTIVWCVFFLLNGTAAALLADFAPLSWWAFYTGLLSYGLIGLLFALEFVMRRMRFGPSPARVAEPADERDAPSPAADLDGPRQLP